MAQVLGMETARHVAQALDRASDAYGPNSIRERPREQSSGCPWGHFGLVAYGSCRSRHGNRASVQRFGTQRFSWLMRCAAKLVRDANRRYGRAILMFVPAPSSH
jgi:hypothetical protein